MATKNMTDEEWLGYGKNKAGHVTYINPDGNNTDQPYHGDNNGQTYAMGNIIPNGSAYTLYDGAQNSRGNIYGDGTYDSGISAAEAAAAIDRLKGAGYSLDGSTKADYDAWVEQQRQGMRDAYNANNQGGAAARLAANGYGNVVPVTNARGYSADGFDLNRIYDAQQKAALDALERAYNTNVAGYGNAKDSINQAYYEKQRQAQAQSDLERMRMNQIYAASGLASGGIGQAALAQSNQLQGNLNALNTQNAADLSQVDIALAQLKADYQGAVAEAISNNELERAKALYQQWQDEQARALQAEQTAYDRQMDMYNLLMKSKQYEDSLNSDAAKLARTQVDTLLSTPGTTYIPESLITASGYDPQYVSALLAYNQQLAEQQAASSRKYSGGGGGGNGDEYWVDQMLALNDRSRALQYLFGLGLSEGKTNTLLSEYDRRAEEQKQGSGGNGAYATSMNNLYSSILPNGVTSAAAKAIESQINYTGATENTVDSIEKALADGRISQAEASYLLSKIGY